MTTILRKFILGVLIAALASAVLPITGAFAAGAKDPVTPPAPGTPKEPATVNARLELVFVRQQMKVTRIGEAVANRDTMTKDIQTLIDKAKSNGKDVSALQAAFEAYKAAFEKGKPIYEQAKAIASTRAGFDANGKVTDTEKARATVKNLAESLRQYRDTVGAAQKTLREAIRAFRAANPRSTPIPAPSSGL